MLRCIDILKAIACLLIANFHSDILFPDKLSLLAFGGDIGNNIFFLVSGFVLYDSINRTTWDNFGKWLGKRYFRILPMVLVMEMLYVFVLRSSITSVRDVINIFVFPTLYWFTGAIIIFYPLLFVVEKIKYLSLRLFVSFALMILHLCYDSIYAERYLIGFIAMIVGCTMKDYINKYEKKVIDISRWVYFTILICISGCYVALKLLRNKGFDIGGVIHLGIGMSTILFAICLLLLLYVSEHKLKSVLENNRLINWIVSTLSSITLSVYLVQGFANRILVRACANMPFPISYILSLLIVIALAYVVTCMDGYFHNKVKGKC